MFKIAKSLFAIVAVAAIAAGSTSAYFSDTATIAGNTFATGELKITASVPSYQRVSFTNLKPGDTIRKWVTLENTGSLDIASLTLQTAHVSGDDDLLGQVQVSVIGWNNGGGMNNAYYTPGWGTGGSPVSYLATAQDVFSQSAVMWGPGPVPGILHNGDTDVIVLDFTVPATLDNAWQGKTASFDLQFNAEQSHTGSALN